MAFRVTEQSLSSVVGHLFERLLGCKVAWEGMLADRTQFDFFVYLENVRFIVEMKIGGTKNLPHAIFQAEQYKQKVGADGVVVIIYPDKARIEVTRPEDIENIATLLSPSAMILCPFLKEYFEEISIEHLAAVLRKNISQPTVEPSVNLVVQTLRQSVQGMSLEIQRVVSLNHPIIKNTISSLSLFDILSEKNYESRQREQKSELTKSVVASLAAYILVNQILLQRILSGVLGTLSPLKRVETPAELNTYFREIEAIDYRAVYCVDIARHLPSSVTAEVNIAITAIRAIEPERLKHDLLGRMFHEFLPFETRKELGTFYTRPEAAEILAGISLCSASDEVLDPACGSGTLLVAAYRQKRAMDHKKYHKTIVEQELTGIDVMPFAAHLAALNLTLQSPKDVTNITRIGVGTSLEIALGEDIVTLAKWAKVFSDSITTVKVEQPLDEGEDLELRPVDLVIMNPPFTRKERLTEKMKGIWLKYIGDQNYWAYFVIAADIFLKEKGRIAAVLPRDFFRGDYSEKVREYLFQNRRYKLLYVVKSTKETAFSEKARFRDYLVVLSKNSDANKCGFVYLKKRLEDLGMGGAQEIARNIKKVMPGHVYEDEAISVSWLDQSKILSNWQDLGKYVVFNTAKGEDLSRFSEDSILRGSGCMSEIGSSNIGTTVLRGLEPDVENLLDAVFIVRPVDIHRVERAKLLLSSEKEKHILAFLKDLGVGIKIPRYLTRKGMKTASYMHKMNVEDTSDYVILDSFDGFKAIMDVSGVDKIDFSRLQTKARDRYSHLLLARRFNIAAPGTKLMAFYSNEKMLGGKAFWTFRGLEHKEAKALCVWLNSTFSIIEQVLLQTETEGSFIELTKKSVLKLHVPYLSKLELTPLIKVFDDVANVEFPPLSHQFDLQFEPRRAIDEAVLSVIGYKAAEIEHVLAIVYSAMRSEFGAWQDMMHKSLSSRKAKSTQLHLLSVQ